MNTKIFKLSLIAGALIAAPSIQANTVYDALSSGTVTGDFRLRYEGVEQDNALSDANALTFRTRLGYESANYEGFSFKVELEDNRIVLGQGDYTVGPTGYNVGIYSVIADPEFTELDQGYIQYKKGDFTVKAGRQVIALDGQRFVGHVGWRQDRQTYDAVTVRYSPSKQLNAQYSYLNQRNRIFGEVADVDAKDHLLNVSYTTNIGKFSGYSYLLEVDNNTNNGLDTYGISYTGSTKLDNINLTYHAEYATQSAVSGTSDFDADYFLAEFGASTSGVTAKLGYELLGSDDGQYGFSTPLATLHKFNGWTDQFLSTPTQGLQDIYISAAGKALNGNLKVAYHEFSADKASDAVDDLGNEINLQYTTKFADKYSIGVKYAIYSAGDIKVDTDKVWVWLSTSF